MRATNELVQTLCGTETGRSHANDENVNVTAAESVSLPKNRHFCVVSVLPKCSKATHMSAMVGD